MVLLKGDNEGQKSDSFACARRHLKDAVTADIERLLHIEHVLHPSIVVVQHSFNTTNLDLFRIDPFVGKEYRETTSLKP